MTIPMELVNKIFEYEENGSKSLEWHLQFFGDLISSGYAWQLQGHYGREANAIIQEGLISTKGEINWELYEENYEL